MSKYSKVSSPNKKLRIFFSLKSWYKQFVEHYEKGMHAAQGSYYPSLEAPVIELENKPKIIYL
jgi:hypothetical protein